MAAMLTSFLPGVALWLDRVSGYLTRYQPAEYVIRSNKPTALDSRPAFLTPRGGAPQ